MFNIYLAAVPHQPEEVQELSLTGWLSKSGHQPLWDPAPEEVQWLPLRGGVFSQPGVPGCVGARAEMSTAVAEGTLAW